jgi:hypothetical protein
MDESALAWVPVAAAMPEVDGRSRIASGFVLAYEVFDGQIGVPPVIEVAYYDYERKQWRARYGKLSGRVTHWQRLPAPPVEEAST